MAERELYQRLQQAGPLTWLLAGCAAWGVLVWLAAMLGMGGRIADPPVGTPAPLPQPGPVQPDRIGPLAQYAEAAARPLFTQDRRPRSFVASNPDGEAGASPAATLDFLLTGVLISPQVRLAMLQPTGGGDAQRVRVGHAPEGASGWRLVEVQPRAAIFEASDGSRSTLDLRTFGATTGGPVVARAGEPAPAPAPAPAASSVAPSTAVAAATAAAANNPVPDQARIEAIRRRIEARRAQLRAGTAQSPSPNPPRPVPDANQESSRPTGGEER